MRDAPPIAVVHHVQAAMRRAALRRQLQAVAAGKLEEISVDLEHAGVDVASLVEDVTDGRPAESFEVQRLVIAFKNSGAADHVIERLSAKSPQQRVMAARIVGALRMYDAVPWLARLLESRDRAVSDAAALALGKIRGRNSAGALVATIQRRGLNRRLVAELARSAPDLYIESALGEPQKPSVIPALALAAGLRRRRAATRPLIDLLEHGTRRERVISCRALGWIGSGTVIPTITVALRDHDWKVRMSAAKALGALHARSAKDDLKFLEIDLNPRVRKAAHQALNQLRRETPHGA